MVTMSEWHCSATRSVCGNIFTVIYRPTSEEAKHCKKSTECVCFIEMPFISSVCSPGDLARNWPDLISAKKVECLADAVLIPCVYGLLILLGLYRLAIQHKAHAIRLRYSSKSFRIVRLSQSLSALMIAIVPLFQLNAKAGAKATISAVEIIGPVFEFICWSLMAIILMKEYYETVRKSSSITRIIPILAIAVQSFKFYYVFPIVKDQSNQYFAILYFISFGLQILHGVLALSYFPSNPTISRGYHSPLIPGSPGSGVQAYEPIDGYDLELEEPFNECPEERAGFFSSIFYSWMGPLISKGYSKPLQESDIWSLSQRDQAEYLFPKFEREWSKEIRQKGADKASLVFTLHRIFWKSFWFGSFLKIFNDVSQFTGPIFLSLITKHVADENSPNWKGYVYAISLFAFQVIGALAEAQYFQYVMRVGMNVRATLITAIFRKTMVLDNDTKKRISTGKINNLMSSDTEMIQSFLSQNINQLWSAPLRIFVALFLLYRELGWPALVGCSLLLTLLPIQKKIMQKIGSLIREGLAKADDRVKVINEVLEAISVVKSYAWENSFEKKVKEIRDSELGIQLKAALLGSINYFFIFTVPVLVSLVSFSVYAGIGNILTPAKAFTALALFDVLRFPMFALPSAINQYISCKVSLSRIRDMLLGGEVPNEALKPIRPHEPVIRMKNGNFTWEENAESGCVLSDINFEVQKGQLVGIIGSTGSGKSSILSALLGEMSAVSADTKYEIFGSVAYVAQEAWIFNDTLRENILFGQHFDDEKYEKVLKACSLLTDLNMMASGDLTEIGERGINLSGGQKQRVSIARATYSDADVYLFDDPLSALDARVGKELFQNCILDYLKDKTRLLVTNQVQFVSKCDSIILIKNGSIDSVGTFDHLYKHSDSFRELMSKQVHDDMDQTEKETAFIREEFDDITPSIKEEVRMKANDVKPSKSKAALIVEEEREIGRVSFAVIFNYIKSMGSAGLVVSIALVLLLSQCFSTAGSIWLSVWSGNTLGPSYTTKFYIGINAAIACGGCVAILTNQILFAFGANSASRNLHQSMLHNLLRAPIRFFNENPTGRIINRFTKDQSDVDRGIAGMTSMYIQTLLTLFASFLVIFFNLPLNILLFIPIMVILFLCGQYYQKTARELKRLDATTRSPLYAHFSQNLNGLSTIRAYRAQSEMAHINSRKLDATIAVTHCSFSANRWLSVRLEFLGGLAVLGSALFIVSDRNKLTSALAGLVLSYSLQITALVNRSIRFGAIAENSFNAVERIQHYASVPQEAPAYIESSKPDENWPSKGKIEFRDIKLRYREDLPLVLKGISYVVLPGQKIGIVGRTGSGKSSSFIALFRLVELCGGSILIDGVDVSKIGLHDLRSNLSIVPQDPVLFTGTVRFNLDPFSEHSDEEIWDALRRVYLDSYIRSFTDSLNLRVDEKGSNFSVGQRQLLCMARALLRKPKILVLDEASASVDVETDFLIQKTIREEFGDCTMLIIAHRINTVIDW